MTTDSDAGLDWFHSLSSPTGTGSIIHTSPVITSTQNATTTLPRAVLPSNSRSIRHKGSAWEKDEDISMVEAVVERGSKKLRGKRLNEMKADLLLTEERVLGGTDDDLEKVFSHSTGKKHSKRKNTTISFPDMDQGDDFRAESGEDLRRTLTKFTFKPRERMSYADQSVANANTSAEVAVQLTAPQMREKQAENQSSSLPPAEGSRANKTLRLGTHKKTKDVSLEVLNDESTAQKGTFEDTEHQQLLLSRLNSLSPGENNGNTNKHPQSPPKTDHPKTKVASSTLAKLSRFSFMGSAEEKTEDKTIPAPPDAQVAINGSTNKVPTSTVSEDQENTSTQTRKNMITDVKTTTLQTGNMRTEASDRQEEFRENASKKRRCFELSSGGPAGLLKGFSLFSSSVIDDEDLDADWN